MKDSQDCAAEVFSAKINNSPQTGHAFPYSINERLVLPWFESLPAKQSSS
jgi:hypothetical protein